MRNYYEEKIKLILPLKLLISFKKLLRCQLEANDNKRQEPLITITQKGKPLITFTPPGLRRQNY